MGKGLQRSFVLPAKNIYVALFMVSCLQQNDTLAKITDGYHGLSWLHQSLGMKNPCESTLVTNPVEACRRKLGKPKTKKEPISPEHLTSLVKDFGHRKASLKDRRLLAICLLGYAGFFRHSELCNIRRSDIIFYRTYVKVQMKCLFYSRI